MSAASNAHISSKCPALKHWVGAPLELRIAHETYELGEGTPQTTISFVSWDQFRRVLRNPGLVFGDAYADGEIEIAGRLSDVLSGYCSGSLAISYWHRIAAAMASKIPTPLKRAVSNAQYHYDVGNDFFQHWLDPTLAYSCAYFETGCESLEEAQHKKFDLICRKLRLEPGNRLLDIGCGWGGLIFHAVENYGAVAIGVTPAEEQVRFVRTEVERRGMEGKIQIQNSDWREIEGQFDRIVSVGMFEHVGQKQYDRFLHKWNQMLRDDGFSVLHNISSRSATSVDPWIHKYIFPGGELPTLAQMATAITAADLRIFRTENLRPHYVKTLAAWSENFQESRDKIVQRFGETFTRRWWLYLQASQASFEYGDLDLLQLELCGRQHQLPLDRELPVARQRGQASL